MDLSKRTGAIVSKIEPSMDYILGSAPIPFDWEKGFKCSYIPKAKDQSISSSCGGFAVSTLKEILDVQHTVKSPKFIYSQTHAVGGGTSVYALGNHLIKKGACSESICSSYPATEQNLTRSEDITKEMLYNGIKDLSTAYAQIRNLKSIDDIACALRDNDGIILGIHGKNNGSWRSENPVPPDNRKDTWAHWVCGVEARLRNGKKVIYFINSWGEQIGLGGIQFITEEYFTSGNIWCAWTVTEATNVIVPEFKYFWSRTLKKGDSNTDVKALQKALKLEGYDQPVTGFFGDITRKNLIKFQEKYASEILEPTGLTKGTGVCATFTRMFLNKKYG
jgi:hypothetical protein